MDKAKAAVSSLMSKAGHHDTTVHETVAPAVQRETVNEQRREEQQVVRDREIHQDHHHTTIQPVKHQEVLPEQHHHNQVAVDHQTHDHRDHSGTKERLAAEAAQFRNETVRSTAQHTHHTAVPEVVGEHVHHHVHEKIQPVIHKETIEPHVVHTTVPVHETHHNTAQHHTASTLPAVGLDEFKTKHGHGILGGRGEHFEHFQGEPKSIEHAAGIARTHQGDRHGEPGSDGTSTGLGHTGHGDGLTGTGVGHTGHHHTGGLGSNTTGSGVHDNTGTTGTHKPSLLDKLNPKKDSNGDGVAGFMK